MEQRRTSELAACLVVALCALAASMGYFSSPLAAAPPNTDSAVFQYVGRVVAEGGMPYLDSFDHKGPLVYLIDALGQTLSATWGLWAIEAAFLVASSLLAYAIARALGAGRLMACAVPLLLLPYLVRHAEGGNLTEQYCMAGLLLVIWSSIRISKRLGEHPAEQGVLPPQGAPALDAFLIGASLAGLFCLRFTELLGALPFCLVALLALLPKRRRALLAPTLAFCLLGVLAVLAPMGSWLAAGGALEAFVADYLAFNLVYAGDASDAQRGVSLTFFLTDPAVLLALVANVALLAADARGALRQTGQRRILAANLAALVLLLAVPATSGRTYGHYLLIVAPAFVVALSVALRELAARPLGIGAGKTSLALFGLAAAFLLVCAPNVTDAARQVAFQRELAPQRQAVVDAALDVHGEGTLLVVGNECWVYLDGGFTAPEPYAFRSDAMAQEYHAWLEGLLASPRAPATIVFAPYTAQMADELDGLAERYRPSGSASGFEIYQTRAQS